MRNPFVMGNWKLNGSRQMTNDIIFGLREELTGVTKCIISIAPPEVYLDLAKRASDGSQIILGAQDVDINLCGSFTGETSAKMLKDIGVKYVIIGHSERRLYHKETDELIAKKFAILKEQNLIPILCIGESKTENENGMTKEVCARQINAIIDRYGITAFEDAVIAYEPIWAINADNSATPEQVQAVHKFIRNYISKENIRIANQIIIQYGGSVNIYNADRLFAQPDIDGALVGRSSLNVKDFIKIIKAAEANK